MPDSLTREIIGAAIEVHKHLGPGLLESIYEECLCHELELRGILFERQKPIEISYKDLRAAFDFRIDLIVDNSVVVELKAVKELHPIYEAQLLTYMKLSGYKKGLIINFNVPLLKDGLKRMVL
ncbi:MAG: GxxExxY protein [Candidatus Erginobacter occultus]|nr:GxxExxY protein [Candidatus Erginobacter occultus]